MTQLLITPPAAEPVTVEEARAHCRIDGNHDDELLYILTRTARETAEFYTGRSFVSTTWETRIDQFPEAAFPSLYIDKAPLLSVTSITYIDGNNATQTLSANNYLVIADTGPYSQPGRIVPAYGTSWPSARGYTDDVRVRYVAGYGAPTDVPMGIKAAIKLMTAHLYENRESAASEPFNYSKSLKTEFPLGFAALLTPFKVF